MNTVKKCEIPVLELQTENSNKRLTDCKSWVELLACSEQLPDCEKGKELYDLFLAGKFAWANNLARIYLLKEPNAIWAKKSAILSCSHLAATQECLRLSREVLESEPNDIFALCHEAAALQKLGLYQDALNKAHIITKQFPDAAQAWLTSAVCADRLHAKKEALFLWKKTLELNPADPFAPSRVLDLLTEKQKYHSAFETLDKAYERGIQLGFDRKSLEKLAAHRNLAKLRSELGDPKELFAKTRLLSKRSQFEPALALLEQYQEAYPGVFVVERYNLLRCLGRYDDLRHALQQQHPDTPNRSENIVIQEAYTLAHEERFDEAITVLEHFVENNKPAPWASQYLSIRYRQAGDLDTAKATIKRCLDTQLSDKDTSISLTMTLANHEVSDNQAEKAIHIMRTVREEIGEGAFISRFPRQAIWWLMQQGRLEEAKKLFNDKHSSDPSRTLLPSEPLKPIKAEALSKLEKQRVILLAVAHNEIERIESFLEHYRSMGISLFLFVDDDSNDGTREYLLSQDDCCVFSSNESYSYSAFGITWIHQLIDRYGLGKWCIHVDIDEFLVFPHCETDSIDTLLDYLERYNYKALPAFMLDMFPQRTRDLLDVGTPLETCPYFDSDLVFMGSLEAPYLEAIGGFRQRITGDNIGGGIALHKTPLVFGSEDIRFLTSTHHVTPTSIADIRVALLHFKFYGDLKSYLQSCLERKEHHACAMVYRWYQRWFEGTSKDEELTGPNSHRYSSSMQLNELGLIKSSVRYESLRQLSRALN